MEFCLSLRINKKKMELEQSIDILKNYQKWRLGADIPMPKQSDITKAIDVVLDSHRKTKRFKSKIANILLKYFGSFDNLEYHDGLSASNDFKNIFIQAENGSK